MTEFDWDRKGPPRPGSGAVARPPTIERPYEHVSTEEKARRNAEYRANEKARVEEIKLRQEYERLQQLVPELKRQQKRGGRLSYFDECTLERYREIRRKLGL